MSHLPTGLPLLVYLHCTIELSPTSQDWVALLWVDFIDHWLIFTFSLPMLLWAIQRPCSLIPYSPLRFYLSRGSSISYWALLYSWLHHLLRSNTTAFASWWVWSFLNRPGFGHQSEWGCWSQSSQYHHLGWHHSGATCHGLYHVPERVTWSGNFWITLYIVVQSEEAFSSDWISTWVPLALSTPW